jgi:hypothetical protein
VRRDHRGDRGRIAGRHFVGAPVSRGMTVA